MRIYALIFAIPLWTSTGFAQEVLKSNEANISANSESSDNPKSNGDLIFNISEKYAGEFEKDPLTFFINNFDINSAIANYGMAKIYNVTLATRRGKLLAEIDQMGKILSYSLNFKDVPVPHQLMVELYRDHKDWVLDSNVHRANGTENRMNWGYYKVVMIKGKEKKSIKYDFKKSTPNKIAENYVLTR